MQKKVWLHNIALTQSLKIQQWCFCREKNALDILNHDKGNAIRKDLRIDAK